MDRKQESIQLNLNYDDEKKGIKVHELKRKADEKQKRKLFIMQNEEEEIIVKIAKIILLSKIETYQAKGIDMHGTYTCRMFVHTMDMPYLIWLIWRKLLFFDVLHTTHT